MEGIQRPDGQTAGFPIPQNKTAQPAEINDTFNSFLNDVNNVIGEAGDTVEKMVAGEITDIHQVMIAAEKASVGLELVVEIRNKLLESYREIMRMQI